jgi:hypothetical protein
LIKTQAATTADKMAAALSKLISPSLATQTTAMIPVVMLARGINTLSYNTN